jgi:predicted nucleic acid-binding protein
LRGQTVKILRDLFPPLPNSDLLSSSGVAASAMTVRRPFAAKRLAIIGMTVQEVLADYIEAVEWVVPTDVPRVVLGDADDDHVIAAAVADSATLIVSGDGGLLSIGSYQHISIVSARDVLARIDAKGKA